MNSTFYDPQKIAYINWLLEILIAITSFWALVVRKNAEFALFFVAASMGVIFDGIKSGLLKVDFTLPMWTEYVGSALYLVSFFFICRLHSQTSWRR